MNLTEEISAALSAWLAFLAGLGVDIEAYLQKGITRSEIQVAEQSLGFELPKDLASLYEFANGQLRPWDAEAPRDAGRWAPMFGNYYFFPIEKATHEYLRQKSMFSDDKIMNLEKPVRGNDPVLGVVWNPGWFPFAGDDNGNMYSVDLIPATGGLKGQVIEHGADDPLRKVVASSVSELMKIASQELDKNDLQRFEFVDPNEAGYGSNPPRVQFNMDWKYKIPIHIDNSSEQKLSHKHRLEEHKSYISWLVADGTESSEARASLNIVFGLIGNILGVGINDFPMKSEDLQYFLDLMQINTDAIRRDIGTRDRLDLVKDDIDTFSKYQLERGKWTADQADQVNNATAVLQNRIR